MPVNFDINAKMNGTINRNNYIFVIIIRDAAYSFYTFLFIKYK